MLARRGSQQRQRRRGSQQRKLESLLTWRWRRLRSWKMRWNLSNRQWKWPRLDADLEQSRWCDLEKMLLHHPTGPWYTWKEWQAKVWEHDTLYTLQNANIDPNIYPETSFWQCVKCTKTSFSKCVICTQTSLSKCANCTQTSFWCVCQLCSNLLFFVLAPDCFSSFFCVCLHIVW